MIIKQKEYATYSSSRVKKKKKKKKRKRKPFHVKAK